MNGKDLRLECLKLATGFHSGDVNAIPDTVVATAEKMIAFINKSQEEA